MDSLITLSPIELERLLITIESSQQVHRRHQYFLWSQGALQSFLPHDVLVFGYGEFGSTKFRCEVLARTSAWEDSELSGEIDRLVEQMVESWQQSGHQPRLYNGGGEGSTTCPVTATLVRLGFGHALAHGTKEFVGDSSGFFVFLRMPQAPGRRHAYFAEMLMPYLHTTLFRTLSSEKDVSGHWLRPSVKLSNRETQVIGMIRDGNTNQQIAETLELSPLTVKNHVQNILRKLEVANRAQAVAKAVRARLIGEPVPGGGNNG